MADLNGVTIKRKKLADFIQNPQNPVAHNPRNYGVVVDSIQEVGALRSGASSKGKILAGNLTWEAMQEAGIEDVLEVTTNGKVWVVVNREDLSPEQERRAAYFDQRSSDLSGWDAGQIVADLDSGLDLSGLFYDNELPDLLKDGDFGIEPKEPPEPQIDRAEELREKWDTRRGQIWEIPSKTVVGKCHRVMCGDSLVQLELDALMSDEPITMLFIDPPYGIDLDTDYSGMPSRWNKQETYSKRYSKVVGDTNEFDIEFILRYFSRVPEQFLWGADYYANKLPKAGTAGTWYVWDKREDESGETFDRMFGSPFELCWSKKKRGKKFVRMRWTGLFHGKAAEGEQPSGDTRFHPTQKPVALARWFLERFADKGGIIADTFLGAGWTMLAAEQSGCVCYGCEIEARYVAVCLQRMQDMGLNPRLIE